MNRLFSIPLRFFLPGLLLGCAAIAGLISWKLNTRLVESEIESQFLVFDLPRAKEHAFQAARRQALEQALIFSGLAGCAWLVLHLRLTRRVARLVATSRQFAAGDLAARTGIAGCDELAQVGQAFDLMADRISEDVLRRQQAEETLRRQQTELRVLFDLIPAMVCFKDTKNHILRANQRLADALGKSVAEIEDKPTADILPDEAARFYEDDLEVIRSKSPKLGIIEMFHDREEKEIWIQTDKIPVFDHEGQVIGLVAMAQNITARQRAEEDLRWKTAFLEAQVNSSIDGILVVDRDGKKILQNQRTAELLKIPPHIAADHNDEQQLRAVTGLMKNPEQFTGKVIYLNSHPDEISRDELELKDGTILDRYSSPVVGPDGKYYGRIWTFRDITERKKIEEALERQKSELRVLFDFIPAMLCFKDTLNGILRVNQRAAKHFGRTVEEVEGRSFFEIDPQGAEGFYEDDLKVIESGLPSLGVIEAARGPAGEELWLQKDKVPVFDQEGKVIGVVVMAQDITERRRNEEKAQRQQTEWRVLFDLMPALIWFKDTENNFLRANQRVVDSTGRPIEEIEGKSAAEIYPQQAAGYYADDLEVIRSGVPKLGIVEKLRGPNDQDLWIQTDKVPYFGEDGKVIGIVVMSQDVTERERTEQSLRLLSSAVEQSKESILITDAELDLPGPRILFVNPAFTQMTGYAAEEVWGKTPRILQGPLTDKAVLAQLRQNLARGEAFAGEAINYRKDGKEFFLEWQVAPLRNGLGTITHFVAIQRDITERKRLEARLFQSQKLETVGKLAGGIAHEFNSILTAIIGQSELLLGDLPAGSPLVKNATEISRAAGRAASLTRQLLAYGRKQTLQPEILDLNAVLAGMENTLRHLLGREADVRLVPATGLKTVKADAGQIEQVIMNLAMNAADAMPRGGKLTLETANATLDEEYVSRHPDLKAGEYVMLAVSDTGSGMSEEVKGRIFEPFFTTKEVGQGTGLGLSTCYGIIKQSGGHISVYAELGRGTVFKVYLPPVEPAAKFPESRPAAPGLPRGTETILLVEDDPALREMAAALLLRLGYTVLAAANGLEALSLRQRRESGHVDLLFTDVVMPHMSGRELADRVQAVSPHTRVLFTSAYTEHGIGHQGGLGQGVALLPKPFTPSALAHKLREVLDEAPAA